FGALFTALTSFDKPFNQAPSLHIALLILIWVVLARHLAPRWRWLLHGWMALIGVSILTTYQHHFIDLPTGLAAGFLALWVLPDDAPSPLRGLAFTRDRKRRRLALLYAAGAAACVAIAMLGGAWLWMFWPATALALVALIYAAIGHRGFQKDAGGRLSLAARWLLAPYLAGAFLNSRIWTRRHPHATEVADGVWIGRIPTARELAPFAAIVDLCAEVSCGNPGARAYRSVGVLDLTTPSAGDLRDAADAIESARAHGPVLVCCALGYSRSAAAVVSWLLTTRRVSSVDEAIAMVRRARPSIVLRAEAVMRSLPAIGS
ncbi:MAG TPA: dual specificity protein phosphatase family protein, partial [Thermoanaerobaculia bacterium]|nr:dual specificity protein phosphatase family protein [Thermoanaerobaculia bacterium]